MKRLFLRTFILLLDITAILLLGKRRRHHYLSSAHQPTHYVKDRRSRFPQTILDNATFYSRLILVIFAIGLIGFIILQNMTPLGIHVLYAMGDKEKNVSDLSPTDRIETIKINGQNVSKLKEDLAYFTVNMPFRFEKARVRYTFQNSYPDQEVRSGFKNKYEWSYDTRFIDLPLLKFLTWEKTGDHPTLFQREKTYESFDEFLKSPPKDKIIGVYKYDPSQLSAFIPQIPGYRPATTDTIIDTPLRGKHTMYVYLNGERFQMKIQKQDLNWYEGEDPMTVRVFKEGDEVYTVTADDDGITDRSNRALSPQEVTIQNPGPDLPEPGVYKVIIDAPSDVVIKRISTNLHKIVFEGNIFPVSNSEVYGDITSVTKPLTLYTDAQLLSAITYHEGGLQNIEVDGEEVPITEVQYDELVTPRTDIASVYLPKTDVILKGVLGYFAFSRESFFRPNPYLMYNITREEDLDLVDFILTDYRPGKTVGDWQVVEREFDLSSAVIQDGKLSWVIQAPGLKENGREIIIKDISVELTKSPWLKI